MIGFAMSVGGVAFAVMLILIVVGLYRGWSRTGSIYRQLPGSLWIAQAGTIDPFHSTSLLSAGRSVALRHVPGVVGAFPIYSRHVAFTAKSGAPRRVRDGDRDTARRAVIAWDEALSPAARPRCD